MNEKACRKCGVVKPLDAFYVHPAMGDGRLNKCKECTKRDVAENYRANRDHYIKYERDRSQSEDRKQQAAVYRRIRRTKSPEKHAANVATSNAIRDGRLIRQPCEICGVEKSEAHHDDYSKPLVVRWLCRFHHLQHHGKLAYGNKEDAA